MHYINSWTQTKNRRNGASIASEFTSSSTYWTSWVLLKRPALTYVLPDHSTYGHNHPWCSHTIRTQMVWRGAHRHWKLWLWRPCSWVSNTILHNNGQNVNTTFGTCTWLKKKRNTAYAKNVRKIYCRRHFVFNSVYVASKSSCAPGVFLPARNVLRCSDGD